MSVKVIRIATRESPLALWQAEHVRNELKKLYPDLAVEIIGIKTQGDIILDTPLSAVGGKGLFIKELEQTLLDNTADIAVHSMKDVTIDLPAGLELPVIMKREDHRDVFISNRFGSIDKLPQGARVGTSSLRRQSQLRAFRPDLAVTNLRGNVGTRLRKLDENEFDGIILAAAGVSRLKLEERVREYISGDIMISAVGQGAIGIETRLGDDRVINLLAPLRDAETTIQLQAERAFSRRLYGGCQLPIAAYAELRGDKIFLSGMVGSVDGKRIIKDFITGETDQAEALGTSLAENLLDNGADKILQELIHA